MKKALIALCVSLSIAAAAQQTKRVLFLGNSYTAANNLPQMVADVASSLGDSLIFDSNTPGGFTLNGHSTNPTTQLKISQGGWDYVILQEQSQLPAFPYGQFSTQSLPYSITLSNQIRAADSCTRPLFYMTWGRKNGDQPNCINYPPLCTYAGMQGELRERYLIMGDTNSAEVAPVGAVWREIRNTNPNIELYTSDESHPSLEGSYLAACTFYASIFHKSPVGAGIPGFMNPLDAQAIQQKANQMVFDSLNVWMIDTLTPIAQFTYLIFASGDTVLFDATSSSYLDSAYWRFGDGTFGSGIQTTHHYQTAGTYNVVLEAWRKCLVDSTLYPVTIGNPWDVDENQLHGISIYPNPTTNTISIKQYDQIVVNADFKVFSMEGELLLEKEKASEVDVSNLAAGSYLLEIYIDKKVSRLKFVKQ